jgi:hypothetical protein
VDLETDPVLHRKVNLYSVIIVIHCYGWGLFYNLVDPSQDYVAIIMTLVISTSAAEED